VLVFSRVSVQVVVVDVRLVWVTEVEAEDELRLSSDVRAKNVC